MYIIKAGNYHKLMFFFNLLVKVVSSPTDIINFFIVIIKMFINALTKLS